MTDGEQQILNMLMQLNSGLTKILFLLAKMQSVGVNVRTQESHRP